MTPLLILALFLWAPAHAQLISTIDGRSNRAGRPDSSATVLIPTTRSAAGYSNRIPVVGTGLTAGLQFSLSPAGAGCASELPLAGVTFTSATQVSINVPNTWRTEALEAEAAPRILCSNLNGPLAATGFVVGVVHHCLDNTGCVTLPDVPGTAAQRAQRALQNTCCRLPVTQLATGVNDVGQCVNSQVQSCCGSAAATLVTERCCNAVAGATATYEGACPCTRPDATTNVATTTCPLGESCCLFSKYTELAPLQTQGTCYNPTRTRCCDSGEIYDPGAQQCCSINGLQSLNIPCPCGVDADCKGSQTGGATGHRCCRQIWPTPMETQFCNKYLAYPDGSAALSVPIGNSPADLQRCWGSCYDPRYQTCCNGVTCVAAYDRCCNATCCNRFTGTCVDAIHAGTTNNRFNLNEFDMHYDQCSVIEQLSPIKSFWIFVLPTYLLVLSVTALALVLVFANKVSTRSYNVLERTMIGLAILIAIFAAACFFAPVYKYGVVMIFLALFTIVVAAARVKWLNVAVVVAYVIALLYLFDPFNGNAYFNFASNRLPNGGVDLETAGILHATWRMYRDTYSRTIGDPTPPAVFPYCTNYYDYFLVDPAMRDFDRYDNPLVKTFGYCSRGWITALLIFEGILLILTLVAFAVVTMALILRLKEDEGYDPIELEVRGTGSAAFPDLGY